MCFFFWVPRNEAAVSRSQFADPTSSKIGKRFAKIWSAYCSHFYGLLTVVGLVIAVLALPTRDHDIETPPTATSLETNPIEVEFERLLFLSTQELRFNCQTLRSISDSLRDPKQPLPIGVTSGDRTFELMANHYEKFTAGAYGEEKWIYQLGLKLQNVGQSVRHCHAKTDWGRWNKVEEMTVDDLLYLCGFLLYYLHPPDVTVHSPDKSEWYYLANETRQAAHGELGQRSMKYFVDPEDEPLTYCQDYLGFID